MSLQEWHERNHFRGYDVPMGACWHCQRNTAVCKSKRAYPDARSAHENARDLNAVDGWAKPVRPYLCRHCPNYHLTSKLDKHARRAIVKQQRKWLRQQAEAEAS